MKKLLSLSAVLIIAVSIQISPALAADPDYPATPSEIIQLFEQQWQDSYDVINDDLHLNDEVARAWAPEAKLYEFGISFADGMDNGYYFHYMDPQNAENIMTAYPRLDDENPWYTEVVANEEGVDKYLSNVNLVLRKLIPKMLGDKRLLPALDRGYVENANTDIWLTLKPDAEGIPTWYIDFKLMDNEGNTVKSYLVWCTALDAAKVDFKAVRND